MLSFYKPDAGRYKIVVEESLFCSDAHVVASQLRLHGLNPEEALIEIGPRPNESFIRTEDIVETLRAKGPEIALILFGGVQYYTGQVRERQNEPILLCLHLGLIQTFDLIKEDLKLKRTSN